MEGYTLYPDYVNYVRLRGTSIELMAIEVKKPGNNKEESDLVRLGKELKTMVNKMVKTSVKNPVAVGVLVKGKHTHAYGNTSVLEYVTCH